MQKREHVSMSVIRRLPRYYRFLSELNSEGETRISSKELSNKMGFTASQIRQDFNCFGGFGQQGYGYNIPGLCIEIEKILGIQDNHKCILIGAGNLGKTIAAHVPFSNMGFNLCGVFDHDPNTVGQTIANQRIFSTNTLESFVNENHPNMAILCVPRESAEELVKELYALGLRSFWNFSHYDIAFYFKDTTVESVHLNDSLMTLSYKLTSEKSVDDNE